MHNSHSLKASTICLNPYDLSHQASTTVYRALPQASSASQAGPKMLSLRSFMNIKSRLGSMDPHAEDQRTSAPPRSRGRSSDDPSARYPTNKQRSKVRRSHVGKSSRASTPASAGEDDDIIRCSMYPQMVGKRPSQLQSRIVRPDRAFDESRERVTAIPSTPARRQQIEQCSSRARPPSVESDLSYDIDAWVESSEPWTRVTMYPQLRYCIEPDEMSSKSRDSKVLSVTSSSKKSSVDSQYINALSTSGYSTRGLLPHNEYQSLVRLQKMQRAREVLEPHFAHNGDRSRSLYVWHGSKQTFHNLQDERQRVSKVKYAVRKALAANFNFADKVYELAQRQHAANVHYCELSDVDGVPIPQNMIEEFTQVFREVEDGQYMSKLTPLRYGESTQRASNDSSQGQSAALERVDSGIAVGAKPNRPRLVSRFSWDSDSDDEVPWHRRLTKIRW